MAAEKILLFGGSGQVGTALAPLLARMGEVSAPGTADVDLRDASAVRAAVRALRPTMLVNAAAYTAVDRAEDEPEAARAVNALAPAAMAEEAARLGARMVHFSTDYVYPGTATRPYVETDATGPLGVYGQTKLEGDEAVLACKADAAILRTSWVFSPHGHNFVRTMLRLAGEGCTHVRVVADQRGTPTSAALLAEAAVQTLGHPVPGGVYHVTHAGETTWHGLAVALFAARALLLPHAPSVTVEAIATADRPTRAQRPAYSVLGCAKWDALGFPERRPWQDALASVLREVL